jgi:hypothetical protein
MVYDISEYHCTTNNININEIEIEFKIIKPEHFVFTCNKKDALFSCITYLTESNYAFITTDINYDFYKYKKYNKKTNEYERMVSFSYPKKMKHIQFKSSNMYGFNNIDLSSNNTGYVLFVNAYKSNENNKNSYEITNNLTISITQDMSIYSLNRTKFLSSEFYENLFILQDNNIFDFLKMIENEELQNNIIINDSYSRITESTTIVKNSHYFFKDIESISTSIFENRFVQRFVFNNIYSKLICNWIIESCEMFAEKNGWNDDDDKTLKLNCINTNNLPHVFDFFIRTIPMLFKYVIDSYNVPLNVNINIKKSYIIKYNENDIDKIDMHNDDSLFTLNIALNDKNEYEGGGTYFNDGTTVKLNMGEMLVHCGKAEHSALPVVKGTRYVLIILVNIDEK